MAHSFLGLCDFQSLSLPVVNTSKTMHPDQFTQPAKIAQSWEHTSTLMRKSCEPQLFSLEYKSLLQHKSDVREDLGTACIN